MKQTKIITAFLLLMLTVTGCTPVLRDGLELHVIAADYSGDPAFFDTVDGAGKIVRRAADFTLDDHLKRMAENMARSGRKKILLYCFGGMNSFEETIEASEHSAEVILKESDYYPVFLNWDSELFGCYFEDLLLVRLGVEDYWLGPPTVPFVFLQHTLSAVSRLPVNLVYQSLSLDNQLGNDMANYLQTEPSGMTCSMGMDRSSHALDPLIRVGYFAGLPFRVLTTGLIDVCGSRAWKEMRRRVRLGFVKDPQGSTMEALIRESRGKPNGVMSRFAEMLLDYARKHPDVEITLIGHCMGTFIATEILERYPALPIRNIVFMAGASPAGETASAVKPYLQSHPEAHFYNLCLHPSVDWNDMMQFCVLPGGSVLTWVNFHLTDPVSKDDLTVGVWDYALYLLPRLMQGVEKQVTLKAFGLDDPQTNVGPEGLPCQHTDFSNPACGFWKPEFWQPPAALQAKSR